MNASRIKIAAIVAVVVLLLPLKLAEAFGRGLRRRLVSRRLHALAQRKV